MSDNEWGFDDQSDLSSDEDRPGPGRRATSGSIQEKETASSTKKMQGEPLFDNLDLLCTRAYRYHSYGGARNFALSRAAHIVKLAFALSVAFLLTNCVDYEQMRALLAETNKEIHENQPYHIDAREFVYYGAGGGFNVFSLLLYGGFFCYIVWLCIKAVRDVRCLIEIGHFCRTRLHLTYQDMQTCEWSEVCERLLRVLQMRPPVGVHDDGSYRDKRTELDIVNRIMRRENYLIAMLNLNVLAWPDKQGSVPFTDDDDDSSLPHPRNRRDGPVQLLKKAWMMMIWEPLFVARTDFEPLCDDGSESKDSRAAATTPMTTSTIDVNAVAQASHQCHPFFTRTLEWAMHFGLFSLAFDARTGALRSEFQPPPRNTQGRYAALQKMARTLRWRFRLMAVVGFLLCPFVLVYILFDFFLQHSEQFRQRSSQQSALTTRRWSNEARWAIREFNELPHLFERRLDAAHQHASLYLSQFSSAVTLTLARLLVYCGGGAIGVLLLLGFVGDDEALTRVNIAFGRSGVWWLTVLGVVVAAARSAIPPENLVYDPRGHMRRCVEHTHYMPETWRDREHTGAVRDRFSRLFEFRWLQCVREMLGIVYTPYLLWTFLPQRSEALVRFFRNYSVCLRDCGYVCRFAVFRLDQDPDPRCTPLSSTNNDDNNDDNDKGACGDATLSSAALSSPVSSCIGSRSTTKITQRPYHGKLEASVLSFRSVHPLWRAETKSGGCDKYVEDLQTRRKQISSDTIDIDKSDDEERWETSDAAKITVDGVSWRQTMARFGEFVQTEFGDSRLPHATKSHGTLPI